MKSLEKLVLLWVTDSSNLSYKTKKTKQCLVFFVLLNDIPALIGFFITSSSTKYAHLLLA